MKKRSNKLTDSQKATALKLLGSGVGPTELSKKFGKTPAYFSQLKKGSGSSKSKKVGRKASKPQDGMQSTGAPISEIVNNAINEAVQKLEGLRHLFK